MIREIWTDPELLKQVSHHVTPDDDIKSLIQDMRDTMISRCGIGIAAVQIGVLRRVVLMCVNGKHRTVINPEYVNISAKKSYMMEGCLSVPNYTVAVKLSKVVKVTYLNEDGKQITTKFNGLEAKCIQHEIDHLNGMTIATKGDK